jgi:hypothetical protein
MCWRMTLPAFRLNAHVNDSVVGQRRGIAGSSNLPPTLH